MVEDMLQLTIDKIFPKNSLKRRKTLGGNNSPQKNIKNRKNSAYVNALSAQNAISTALNNKDENDSLCNKTVSISGGKTL